MSKSKLNTKGIAVERLVTMRVGVLFLRRGILSLTLESKLEANANHTLQNTAKASPQHSCHGFI